MRMKHVKTGRTYSVLMIVIAEDGLIPTVVYQGDDGVVWTRPAFEFFDGRFVVEVAAEAPVSQMGSGKVRVQ